MIWLAEQEDEGLPIRVDIEQCGIVGVRYTKTRFPAT